MKKIGMGLLLALALVACASTPTPDPDHGVSNASYRQSLTKVRDNLGGISAKMKALKAADQAMPQPVHSDAWWDAQIGLLGDTATLASDTLAGASK